MWNMLWPLLLIVGSNCCYHICAKSTPTRVNAFGALTVTYLISAALCGAAFLATVTPEHAQSELRGVNWTSYVLGFAVVGLEAGNLFLYRAGWKISAGSVVSNISLAVVLLFVGYFLFHEHISARQLLGVAVCAAGLYLITK
ncbi:MAG: EamA family transporter [Oscillospiraceae bacterium]|nr:EamA family transporter [Oscillospiraceae bacterium]